jgi:hypothetical protein
MIIFFIYYEDLHGINPCMTSIAKVCFSIGMIVLFAHVYIKEKHFNKEKTFRLPDLFTVFLLLGFLFKVISEITC